MKPGIQNAFRIDFKPKETLEFHKNYETFYSTLDNLLSQFEAQNIEKFTIEVYGYTCQQEKVNMYFKNETGKWTKEIENKKDVENFFSILEEHKNLEVFFNVTYSQI